MLVPLTRLDVTAETPRLDDVLRTLQSLRVAEIIGERTPFGACDDSDLSDRVCSLLQLVPDLSHTEPAAESLPRQQLLDLLDTLERQVSQPVGRIERLRAEADSLPHYVTLFASLQPLLPELGRLDADALGNLGLTSVALVLEDPHGSVLRSLRATLTDLLGPTHLFVASEPDAEDRVSCLLVLRRERLPAVRTLLGAEFIEQLTLPTRYGGRSLRSIVSEMQTRLLTMPGECARAEGELRRLLEPVAADLVRAAIALAERTERQAAAGSARHTDRAFTLSMWVPTDRVPSVISALETTCESRTAIDVHPGNTLNLTEQPVLLRNRGAWLPFQGLVGLLSWPAPRTLDPTGLMAIVLPLFFGMMVGDLGYGLALFGLAWAIGRLSSGALAHQGADVLRAGALWAMVFGLLFGEFLGSVGHQLGLPALWFYRGGPQALPTLLLFSVAVGLAHVVLALLLGVWTATRLHQRGQLGARAGNLAALIGLCGIAAVSVSVLPTGLMTPALAVSVVVSVVGLVLASVSQGLLGLLLGPLGLLGLLGNVLSYLRIAAVGLASVYLAGVANELALQGPLLLGLIVAAFFHVLNLALAAFSPMVQALRLHYVEFFGQFYDGDGRLFAPFGQTSSELTHIAGERI